MQIEIWKDVPNYEGYYQVSNLGRVKSFSRIKLHIGLYPITIKEKILTCIKDANGYLFVNLFKNAKRDTRKIHQLVSIAFLNHSPCGFNLVINHKDFNRTNNRVENLEIVTMRENGNHKHLKSSSEYTGVHWRKDRNKWRAQIRINGKQTHLGYFSNELDASNAYENALKNIVI